MIYRENNYHRHVVKKLPWKRAQENSTKRISPTMPRQNNMVFYWTDTGGNLEFKSNSKFEFSCMKDNMSGVVFSLVKYCIPLSREEGTPLGSVTDNTICLGNILGRSTSVMTNTNNTCQGVDSLGTTNVFHQ